eukprot:m.41853 g.41853  ORF g.41853 m.41853 type:complete len:497 (+) comp7026_c0_seq2:5001-6491(+)
MMSNNEKCTMECVLLRKPHEKLGFHLTGSGAPYVITGITEGGLAHLAGVRLEDRILSINGVDVSQSIALMVVTKLISEQANELKIVVHRNNNGTTDQSPLPQQTNANHNDHVCDGEKDIPSLNVSVGSGDDDSSYPPTLSFSATDTGAFSRVGSRHGDVNQDNFYAFCGVYSGVPITIGAVFDGHGMLGEVASKVAVKTLHSLCSTYCQEGDGVHTHTAHFSHDLDDYDDITMDFDQIDSAPKQFMTSLFQCLNAKVLASHDSPPSQYTYYSGSDPIHFELKENYSDDLGSMYLCPEMEYMPPRPIDFGCTAVVGIVYKNSLLIGNAGDADAIVLVKGQKESANARDGYLATSVTEKHTASSEKEQDRINRDFPDCAFFTPDGYLAPTEAVISQYEVQLTRSLGHRLLARAGVIGDPEIVILPLDERTAFGLVLCSDGITDELSVTDILDRVRDASNAAEAAELLSNDAHEYVMDDTKIDDCTALVLMVGLDATSI